MNIEKKKPKRLCLKLINAFFICFQLSPYMQRVLNGKVMQTYLRGQQIYSHGEDIQSPVGQLIINEDVLSKL